MYPNCTQRDFCHFTWRNECKNEGVCVYFVEVDYNVNDCELWIRVSRSCIDIRRELLTYQCTIMVLVGEQP